MGKYGLSGSSGMVGGGLHIAASYDCNGMVFVEVQDEDVGLWWKRVAKEEAEEGKIIKCSMCDKPAVSLDHYWPYYTERCLCADHFGSER